METTDSSASQVKVGSNTAQRKSWPVLVAVLAAVVFLGGALYTINNHGSNEASASNLVAAQVQITSSGFVPATVKIKKGQQITVTNTDVTQHDPLANSGLPAMDGTTTLQQGESLTVTAEQTGTYSYHDTLSTDNFTGTIIVE
ncbi:MAG TPA: cupredoxin domain-containing protein [Candidatus Saccharimonadales bacterium]|nr:cupredoxin domain-containing protein [Candidatus Saccharimonadales bacterium]